MFVSGAEEGVTIHEDQATFKSIHLDGLERRIKNVHNRILWSSFAIAPMYMLVVVSNLGIYTLRFGIICTHSL